MRMRNWSYLRNIVISLSLFAWFIIHVGRLKGRKEVLKKSTIEKPINIRSQIGISPSAKSLTNSPIRKAQMTETSRYFIWNERHKDLSPDQLASLPQGELLKIACFVLTSNKSLSTKAVAVRDTWAKGCDMIMFVSDELDASFPTVQLSSFVGYEFLWGKVKAIFRYLYYHHLDDFDYFVKADDDTFFSMHNLRNFLSKRSPDAKEYYGQLFDRYVPGGYNSGGAGYILGRSALKLLVEKAFKSTAKRCYLDDITLAEDVQMGRCLQTVGVVPAKDCLGSDGKSLFNALRFDHEVNPRVKDFIKWYQLWSYHQIGKGLNQLSNETISCHNATPEYMYLFHYLFEERAKRR